MLTIRDLKDHRRADALRERRMPVNYGDRVALVGPNGAGKSTLFSIILKQTEPDAGTVERDEWTMVGYLPQEAEAHGDETVLDVATGRVDELPRAGKAAARTGEGGRRVRPGIPGGAREARRAERSAGGDEGEEDVARPRLSRHGFRPEGARDERRLDHARAPGAAAGDGAGPAAAGRADEPPRPALAALAAELSEELFRRGAADFARPPVHGRGRRARCTKSRSRS